MRIKWYGTAGILLEQDGVKILFDPFFPRSKKVYIPPIEEFSSSDAIFVTHGHFDHIADIPKIAQHGKKFNKKNIIVHCTSTPVNVLLSRGLEISDIIKIKPGDNYNFKPFAINVLKGRHIVFNKGLVLKTFLSPRVLIYLKNLINMLKEAKGCDEAGETVVYDINVKGKRIFLMGSLNLDPDAIYPNGADLLIMPFQGRSDINRYAMQFIEKLKPKKVLLDHFDNTFPPISSKINPDEFVSLMKKNHPDIEVIVQDPSTQWIEVF